MTAIRPLFGILLIVAMSRCALAQVPMNKRPTVSVVGVGEVNEDPDIARLSVQVYSVAASLAEAQAENEQRVAAMINVIEEHGGRPDDLRPIELQVTSPKLDQVAHKHWDYIRKFDLTVRDIPKLETIISELAKRHVDEILGVEYSTTRRAQLEKLAREKAIAAARAKAAHMAGLLHMDIGKPIAISDRDFLRYNGYRVGDRDDDGRIHVKEEVDVVFELIEAAQSSQDHR